MRENTQSVRPEEIQVLLEWVAAELKTTFASHYSKVVSLPEALSLGETL